MMMTYEDFLKVENCEHKSFIYDNVLWNIEDRNNKPDNLCISIQIINRKRTVVARRFNKFDIITLV